MERRTAHARPRQRHGQRDLPDRRRGSPPAFRFAGRMPRPRRGCARKPPRWKSSPRCSPFPVPRHVALGRPAAATRCLGRCRHGSTATSRPRGLAGSAATFAGDLAEFIARAARRRHEGPPLRRRRPRRRSARPRRLGGGVHPAKARRTSTPPPLTRLWAEFRELPRTAPDAMVHGDLIPANVLVRERPPRRRPRRRRFRPADPALELVCAWHLLDPGRAPCSARARTR